MIIDAHTHLLQRGRDFSPDLEAYYLEMYRGMTAWRTGRPYTAADWCTGPATLVADMDAAGVDAAVVMTLGSVALGGHDPGLAEDVASWCADYPGRLIGMLTADPLGGDTEAARIVREVPRLGLSGVKILPSYSRIAINDVCTRPIYQAAAELGLPVIVHTGWCAIPGGRTLAHDHPLQLEDVLADTPDLRLVVAHCGFAWSEHVLFMLAAHPTVYADLAYWSQTMPAWRAAQTLSHARQLGVHDRLLWGTDYPFASPADDLVYWRRVPAAAERLGLEPHVEDGDIDVLLGHNAASVFGLAAAKESI